MNLLLNRRLFTAALATSAAAACAPLTAQQGPGAASTPAGEKTFAKDREAILAMAGDYRVRFDFRETASFLSDYEPIAPKTSGGHEAVRVIADTGRFISLQHILVIGEEAGPTGIVKHWRQDWTYEPEEVLTYSASGKWVLTPVAREKRAGAWAQTVWQVDDSPRYGGIGRWEYDFGATRWTSDATFRPLARRDATRHPPYDRYLGINRHALTPKGWIHEQDNAKIGTRNGEAVTFVHEVVLNTYAKAGDLDLKLADAYWSRTQGYWTQVRAAWDEAIARGRGVSVQEEPEFGAVTGPMLLSIGDNVAAGDTDEASAAAEARSVIAEATQALAHSG